MHTSLCATSVQSINNLFLHDIPHLARAVRARTIDATASEVHGNGASRTEFARRRM
jgi:hypothetical protein